jgi:prepilin-type N-terminal cleavage/methylation domain-containing protein
MTHKTGRGEQGFTLVELAIVLVIIGLIIGGVLVGKDMIDAAAIRAQITQIDKYNTAVHAFQVKYDALPGDIADPAASNFGFVARGPNAGQGDGNGVIEGTWSGYIANTNVGDGEDCGETVAFWVDLSAAKMIDGSFTSGGLNPFTATPVITTTSSPSLAQWLPSARISKGNSVYVWSNTGIDYFGLSGVVAIPSGNVPRGQPGLTVQQAYSIDNKIDDGLPQSGRVTAQYLDDVVFGASNTGLNSGWAGSGGVYGNIPYTTTTAGSSTTCFDNSNAASGTPGVNGATQHYSLEINNGTNLNCALSFQFQ